MRFLEPSLVLLLAAGLSGTLAGRQPPSPAPIQAPVQAPAPDWASFIGPFPGAGSEEARADLAILLWLQRHRSAEDIRRAEAGVDLGPHLFSEALGRTLDRTSFPRTLRLLDTGTAFLRGSTRSLKPHFGRPRPYDADPRIRPCIRRESSLSYPSGHASHGVFWSVLLAEVVPGRSLAILDKGLGIGADRNVGGVHWPSDVEAGQKLGRALAELWLRDPATLPLLAAARGEWTAP